MALEQLIATRVREDSGARTSSRYDYQKNWALCHLLRLHANRDNYLLVFEFHDDVLEFEAEMSPSRVTFIQVKTKQSGHWTRGQLTTRSKRNKKQGPSILGILFANGSICPSDTDAHLLVSNARFKLKLNDSTANSLSLQKIRLAELEVAELRKLLSSVEKELGQKPAPISDKTFFEVTDLSLDGHETHTRGKLSQFLETQFPTLRFRVDAVHQALFGEIQRRTSAAPSAFTSLSELADSKGIGPTVFDSFLTSISLRGRAGDPWERFESRLNAEGAPFHWVQALENGWKRCAIESVSSRSPLFSRLRALARETVAGLPPPARLTDYLDAACRSIRSRADQTTTQLRPEYIQAMVLVELDNDDRNVSPTRPQSEEEDA